MASEELFDFGDVLSKNDPLTHSFQVRNPTDRPVKVLDAVALVPCCSKFVTVPDSVASGGCVSFAMELRPGPQSGPKVARFTVRTDDRPGSELVFTLKANFIPEVAVEPVEGPRPTQPVGKAGRFTLRVACRRIGDEGLGAPDAVEVVTPLVAPTVVRVVDRERKGAIETEIGEVTVQTPADMGPGVHGGEVRFRWADGRSFKHVVFWEVVPTIRAIPPAVVVRDDADEVGRKIMLRADDVPFRVVGVECATLDATCLPAVEAKLEHDCRLRLKPRGPKTTSFHEVFIVTDHPLQPKVRIEAHLP